MVIDVVLGLMPHTEIDRQKAAGVAELLANCETLVKQTRDDGDLIKRLVLPGGRR